MSYSFFQPHGATSSRPIIPTTILHNVKIKNSSFGKPIVKKKKKKIKRKKVKKKKVKRKKVKRKRRKT